MGLLVVHSTANTRISPGRPPCNRSDDKKLSGWEPVK